jgi:hypothetical protein
MDFHLRTCQFSCRINAVRASLHTTKIRKRRRAQPLAQRQAELLAEPWECWLAVGGFIGALVGMGIPEYEARRYEGRVKDGGILLSVHCETPGEILRAREILTTAGATDIASSTESAGVTPAETRTARPSDRVAAPK